MLRISPAFARKLASEGKLPGVLPRLGKEWRVNREALEGYIRRPVAQPSARSDHAWNEVHTARESRNDARASDRA